MNDLIKNIFVATLIITVVAGYSIAHKPQTGLKIDLVKASDVVVSPSPTPKPCQTWTPYDKLIEKYFKDSCNAKRILRWVDLKGNLYGENTLFITVDADRQNRDGSWDRGLMRINSNTFAGYLKRMPKLMHENGLYEWDDMLDIEKNIRMASIIYTYQGYCAWFAAPNDLCSRNYPGITAQ